MSDATKPELKPANDNPWYFLATLYGESGNADLTAKNRIAWNRWYASALTEEKLRDLITKGFPRQELIPFTEVEIAELVAAFESRSGRKNELPPVPTGYVDFRSTHFQPVISFGGYLFANDTYFDSAMFSSYANFQSAVFSGLCYFSGAKFIGKTSFASATFCGKSYFSNATFSEGEGVHGSTTFRSAFFAEGVYFTRAKFNGSTSFEAVIFSSAVHFDEATFLGMTQFELAKFHGNVDFRRGKFRATAYFLAATFNMDAGFNAATFSDFVDFKSAKFSMNAYFDSTEFAGDSIFFAVTFAHVAYFASASFSGAANFALAVFSGSANFKNVKFMATTRFVNARFGVNVPDFRGATMHEATEWHGAHWPVAPCQAEEAQKQVYAYERLKQEMDRLKKHEDEQFFFRKELRARRGTMPTRSWAWWLNAAYEDLSGYGQSAGRPFAWLLGLFTIGMLLLGATPSTPAATTMMGLQRAASLNYAYIFSIFPFHHAIAADQKFSDLSGLGQAIFLVESLFGTLLLFLVGLALRNRFRMK